MTSGLSVLAKMSNGGYYVDTNTSRKKFYGKWWLALFASVLAMPFIIASSVMPLCLQTDMLDLMPNFLPWVVVVTKVFQSFSAAVVWVLTPSCRFQNAPR
jgi:hypothetical protein